MLETTSDPVVLLYRFGTALALGLLIGLQREFSSRRAADERREFFAGTRTYALYALLGASAAFLSAKMGSALVLAVVLLATAAVVTTAYVYSVRAGRFGMTSEVAAFITLLAGAMCLTGDLATACVLAVTTTVLLALKVHTRALASRLTDEDVRATLTFAVLTLVVLPVLPRHGFGPPPFDVLVPYKIWLMVVLISGISFTGFVLIKVIGTERGVGLTGFLGGLASSTAVTLSFAERSRDLPQLARPFAFAILLAWTVMYLRVLVEVATVNPALLEHVWLPLAAAILVSLIYCAVLYGRSRGDREQATTQFDNPFELGPALRFGALYMLILLAANAARLYFGHAGLYVSSIAAGLADVDAITLSMAELARDPVALAPTAAARAIVLATAANTLVKGGIVLMMGSASLKRVIWPGLLVAQVVAISVVWLV